MNISAHLKYLFYWVGMLIVISQYSCSSVDAKILTQSSDVYKEIMPIARDWKDAVLNNKIDTLASYALPESQEHVKNNLANAKSNLYRIFYDNSWNKHRGGRSYCEVLKTADRLTMVVEQTQNLENYGGGLRIYFYDASRLSPKFPLGNDIAQQMIKNGDIIMVFFFKAEGRWYASYNIDND